MSRTQALALAADRNATAADLEAAAAEMERRNFSALAALLRAEARRRR